MNRVLVVTAVEAEREALFRGLNKAKGFEVLVTGVGPAAAAAFTARALAAGEFSCVVSAGIGGGFSGKAGVGTIVVATQIVAADLGAETPEGFLSLDELGFGSNRITTDDRLVKQVSEALLVAELPVITGPVLTVNTVTGTAASAAEMAARVPGAAAEAMEGYGAAFAAQAAGTPIMEIRAISNLVGPRDRSAWRIREALDVLAAAGSILSEVLR